jgi:sec-independent protein translocase protein TatA
MITLASFGNAFGFDTLIIFFLVLLLFGAKKLPELAKGLGQAVREFSKAKDDFHNEINNPPATPPPPQQIEAPKVEVAQDTHAQSMDSPGHPQPVEHTQPQTSEHHHV